MSDYCAVGDIADAQLDQWFDRSRASDSDSRARELRGRERELRGHNLHLHQFELKSPATVIYFEAGSLQSIEPELAYHAAKWVTETAPISSIQQAMEHPSYKRIMAMADKDREHVLTLILRELKARPNRWFHALMSITGENPVKPRDAGRFDKMVNAWLDWGR